MSAADWAVVVLGAAAIAWVNWYFFAAHGPAAAASAGEGGVQQVTIAVRGGYEPGTVRVRAGSPVRLLFDRRETSGCSEEVVLPAFGIRRFLPAFQTTAVELTPQAAGTYEFTCGMGMLRGRIVVEA
jgi:plastocyanin domain-containing protein